MYDIDKNIWIGVTARVSSSYTRFTLQLHAFSLVRSLAQGLDVKGNYF